MIRDMLVKIVAQLIHERLSPTIDKNRACGAAELIVDLCINPIAREACGDLETIIRDIAHDCGVDLTEN